MMARQLCVPGENAESSLATLVEEATELASRFDISVAKGVDCLERIIDGLAPHLLQEPRELASVIAELPCRLLRDTLEYFPCGQAVEFLSTEDISLFVSRMLAAEYLVREDVPFFGLAELIHHTHDFADFLLRHRDYLVTHGLPPCYFVQCPWLHVQIASLYGTRKSTSPYSCDEIFRKEQLKSRLGQSPPYNWYRTPNSEVFTLLQVERCQYSNADLLSGMSRADVERIERDRLRLFEVKIAIVRHLSDLSSHSFTANDLWKTCLAELTKVLDADDVEFYLDMDRWYLGGNSRPLRVITWNREWSPGGLTNLVDVVGWFAAELSTKTMDGAHQADNGVLPGALLGRLDEQQKPPWAYFGLLTRPDRNRIDRVLDEFVANVERTRRDLIVLDAQLQADLNSAFGLQETVGLPPKYSLLLPGHASRTAANAEVGGLNPAPPTAKAIEGLPDTKDNVFRRTKRGWKIGFQGGEPHDYPAFDGLMYISTLLFEQDRAFTAFGLYAEKVLLATKGVPVDTSIPEIKQDLKEANVYTPSNAGERSDRQSRQEYRKRLREIEEELEEAVELNDKSRIISSQKDKETLLRHLTSVMGLRGGDVQQSAESKKAADKVRNAIERAISVIEKDTETLSTHLRKSLVYSPLFKYSPETKTFWLA